jgi:hypothetical protein
MKLEKRRHHRHKPKPMQTEIRFTHAETEVDAEILDISYSGIRVKLKQAISSTINERVKITMTLPESKAPFSIHGILKHQANSLECGIHYTQHITGSIDDVMFECLELDNSTIFIKTP